MNRKTETERYRRCLPYLSRPCVHKGGFRAGKGLKMGKIKLSKYEKETIIRTSEGEKTYSVYTFDRKLKRKLSEYAEKYPSLCYLEREDKEVGAQTYVVDKNRMSIRFTAPYSEERRRAASDRAKKNSVHLFRERDVEEM